MTLESELARYRRAHGLAPTPQPGETRPLLLPVIGSENRDKGLSRGALHLILKEVFGMAADLLRGRGPEWEAQAAVLASASAHWLRHTAGSHMTDQTVPWEANASHWPTWTTSQGIAFPLDTAHLTSTLDGSHTAHHPCTPHGSSRRSRLY
ncbi:hypothetical protein AU476_25665 [Cupriavidus sp. UYMSc13B]|nr:hypothetical protein AU476_25665 [Cupriavidus sp. UYMSc13B]